MNSATWARPAVFGAFDGLTVSLGVLLSLTHQQHLIVPTTVGVAAAEAVGMAAGEWLSSSDTGLAASAVIGAATGLAGVIPVLPYLWVTGWPAMIASVCLLLVLAAGISLVRAAARGWGRALAETYGVLLAVAAVVAALGLIGHTSGQPTPPPPRPTPRAATPSTSGGDQP